MTSTLSLYRRKQIFTTLASALPSPQSELTYQDPFQLLIAVILSAQATDKAVNQVTQTLFTLAPNAQTLYALGDEKICPIIQRLGLYRAKSRNIWRTAGLLLERHNGQVPADRAALEALPGVGRKTAGVVLNVAFGQPTIAVDTHVFRVSKRLGLATGNTPDVVEQELLKSVPKHFKQNAHHWLILHGRYVCKARTPLCSQCSINPWCQSAPSE